MTSRDPNNPARRQPAAGAPARRGGGRLAADADDGNATQRRPVSETAPSARRERPAPPPPVTSRSTVDPFAAADQDAREDSLAAGDADPFTVSNRRLRAVPAAAPSDDPTDPAAWSDLADEWAAPDQWEALAPEPTPRPAPSRRRARAPEARATRGPEARAQREPRRARPTFVLPEAAASALAVGGDLLRDRVAGIILAANLASLVALIARVATLTGQLPATIVIQLDAAGIPSQWAAPGVLWRLPLLAGMTLLMSLVVAWFVAPIDRFAARFVLGAALGIQLLVWIAVLDFV